MKKTTSAFLATLCVAGAAVAQSADDMVGTWECRQAGVEYKNKPPILYIEGTSAKDPKQSVVFQIDGFTREVYGLADMTADSDGWWKISPAQGDPFLVKPEAAGTSKTAAMALKRGAASFRCLRLPADVPAPSGTPASSAAPAPSAPATSAAPAMPAAPSGTPAPN
jgi:hypothetical protein